MKRQGIDQKTLEGPDRVGISASQALRRFDLNVGRLDVAGGQEEYNVTTLGAQGLRGGSDCRGKCSIPTGAGTFRFGNCWYTPRQFA
jgi:hypothetical protein